MNALAKYFRKRKGTPGFDLFYIRGDLLDIYVGTDEHIIKEEDLSLLRLQDLSPLAIHGLNKRLTKDQ